MTGSRNNASLGAWDDAAELAARGLARGRTAGGVSYAVGGAGPFLFLLHGGSGSWNHWIANLAPLSRDFRVAALDLPSFGLSDPIDPKTPNPAYVDATCAAIAEIAEGAPFDLAGFSFGGFLAACVAKQMAPQTARLSLIGPNGFPPPERELNLYGVRTLEQRLGRPPAPDELREMHRNNLSEMMLSSPVGLADPLVDLHIWNVERTRFNSRRLSWSGEMATLYPTLELPTLVLFGERDRSQTPTIKWRMEELKAMRPETELLELAGAGHWAMFEKPDAANAALQRFHGGA
ncbi:MAG: alpha/beta hydrolase [Pseudomonadota bacterium]